MGDTVLNLPSEAADERVFPLSTGVLTTRVHDSLLPMDDLVKIASRQNRKRGFLFASRVLGKHIAAPPSVIREVHSRLASEIPDLPGPILFIGMAETAIALGHGVFDRYVAQSGRQDCVFLHTTRYRINREMILEFKEEHSHAAEHYLYLPKGKLSRRSLGFARSVVLIDDEASTGATFHNLLAAIKRVLPNIEQAATVVITDWRGVKVGHSNTDTMPLPATPVALLHGEYTFTPSPDLENVSSPPAVGNNLPKDHLMQANFGRMGLIACEVVPLRSNEWESLRLAINERSGDGQRNRVLVLGTGEFAYPPFLFAEHLEKTGLDVWYQSTTRSPIMQGMAIEERLVFHDNYEDGINNYLYNARRVDYDLVIVCHETPAESIDNRLVDALGAQTMRF